MSDQRAQIPGSATTAKDGERWSAPLDPNSQVSATVLMRRQEDGTTDLQAQLLSGNYHPASREDASAQIAASPHDLDAVRTFLDQHGLTIAEENGATRRFQIGGTAGQMEEAFGVELGWVEDAKGERHISYRGNLSVPENLAPIVSAVLGLDQRPIARHAST